MKGDSMENSAKSARPVTKHRHVWNQFIPIFLALIIPVFYGAIRGNIHANQRVVEAEEQRALQLSQVKADDIGNRMDRALNILYNYYSGDIRLNTMRKSREKDSAYTIAKVRFFSELRSSVEWVTGANGYYYYVDRVDDFLATGQHAEIQQMEAYYRNRMEAGKSLNGWTWEEENKRLILNVIATQLHYGYWINLEDDIRELNEALGDSFVATVCLPDASVPDDLPTGTLKEERTFALGNSSVMLTLYMDTERIRQSLYPALMGNLGMIAVYLLLLPVLLFVLYRMIIRPFREIEKAHYAVRGGNLDYRIGKRSRYAEFDAVYQSFDRMVENIQNLRIENYEKEQEKQKMLLRNLLLQIQPHFLLNTFSMIYALVQTGQREAVQDIVLYLSDYFRYLVRNDAGLLPFAEEWKLIQGYMRVASIRYPGQVRLEADIDEALLSYRIPPLLIHNFLENGIDPELCMTIRFRLYREDGAVYFLIEDDGNGMLPETLERNNAIISGELDLDSQTEHIGLYNSVKRLRFFYGERATVVLNSMMGEGTSFLIRIQDDEMGACPEEDKGIALAEKDGEGDENA